MQPEKWKGGKYTRQKPTSGVKTEKNFPRICIAPESKTRRKKKSTNKTESWCDNNLMKKCK